MEFRDVVRRRRMIRDFAPRPVPRPVLDRVLETALHAPSAGFAQGLELVVLEEEHDLERFWRITDPRARKRGRTEGGPPVVVLAVANRNAYLERYSEPDKRGLGMDSEEGWPVPYWDLDAAMSVMLMLLAAVDEGLGAWFFGIFAGEPELSEWLGIPGGGPPLRAFGPGPPPPRGARRGGGGAP